MKTQSLTRRFRLPVLLAVCLAGFAPARGAQKTPKPLNPQEVKDLVQNYVPSERIIELIHQFGISFEPSEQYLKDLKRDGADSALIGALHAVQPRVPAISVEQAETLKRTRKAIQSAPLSYNQISNLLVNNIPNDAIIEMVNKYGITFDPDKDFLKSLRKTGADEKLIAALRKAKVISPPPVPKLPVQKPQTQEAAKTTAGTESEPAAKREEVKSAQVKSAPMPPAEAEQESQAKEVSQPAPKPPQPTGPYNVGGDVSPPAPLYTPNAPYTEQARRAHLQGEVILAIVINEHGKVTKIQEVSKPLGQGLDESAIQTVGTWVFRPAQFRGAPVPVRVNVKVGFHQQF
jgi:TonB family protein